MRVKIIGLVIILAAAGILSLLILRAGRESAPVKTVKIAGSPLSSAPAAPIKIYFTTSVDKAPYGNFNFTYPVGFFLKEDDIKSDSAGKKYHVVVLERTAAPAGAIEINRPGKACSDYAKCETAKGVVIGTNSTDTGFLGIFNEVVGGF